jgi:hypothetical protein
VGNQLTAYRFWQYGSLGLSVLLYLLCLPLDAFCASACQPSYSILISGPFGLLASLTNWTWLANPVLFGAWVALAFGAKTVSEALEFAALALALSVLALLIAISFLLQREVIMNEAGIPNPIRAYGIGYWVWLSSMVVCCFGSMATTELSVAYKNKE